MILVLSGEGLDDLLVVVEVWLVVVLDELWVEVELVLGYGDGWWWVWLYG